MNKDDRYRPLESTRDKLSARSVQRRFMLFGSTVRDEARDDSDIDVLVDYDPDTRFAI